MVAKAATRSGEFFCFHCGKAVQKGDARCKSCGVDFDRIIDSFRCPRCSNLLPVGAAACPSCNLGFKVKTVTTDAGMSDDDRFLMKLIEWGKQDQNVPPPSKSATRTVRVAKAPPPPPPLQEQQKQVPVAPLRQTISAKIAQKTEIGTKNEAADEYASRPPMTTKPSIAISASKTQSSAPDAKRAIKQDFGVIETSIQKSHQQMIETKPDVQQLIAQLEDESRERDRLENEIRELRGLMQKQKAMTQEASSTQEPGLSTQALKKILEERDKEIKDLKTKEEELARREEHLNRKIKSYAVKMKEFETSKRQFGGINQKEELIPSDQSTGGQVNAEFVDERGEWIRDQIKIKAGLIEIRNQMASNKEPGQVNYYPSQPSGDLIEKIEVLEEKIADIDKERSDLREQIRKIEESKQDISTLLKVLDQLLGKLPPEIIDEFSKSDNFKLYEKVLDELNI